VSIYEAEHEAFDHVNWATIVSKLGKASQRQDWRAKQTDSFRSLLRDLSSRMMASCDVSSFGGVREVANIVHSLAKLRVDGDDDDVRAILSAVDASSEWLVTRGKTQEPQTPLGRSPNLGCAGAVRRD
jgi:hypothetical protein